MFDFDQNRSRVRTSFGTDNVVQIHFENVDGFGVSASVAHFKIVNISIFGQIGELPIGTYVGGVQ